MRITQIINVRWFNATAWYALFLSRLLLEAGHEVRVLALPGTESFAKAAEMGLNPQPLQLNSNNPLTLAQALLGAVRHLQTFRPHIVNCHRGEGFLLWGILRMLGFPFALVRTRGDQRPPRTNIINKILYNSLADALISTNSQTTQALAKTLHCRTVHTILGGVDTRVFFKDAVGRERVRAEFNFSESDLVVGILGRFDAVKGQLELIEAIGNIRSTLNTSGATCSSAAPSSIAPDTSGTGKAPQIKLMLMGFSTSLSQAAVEEALTRHKLADCAVITGKRADVAACISAMDLGVIASQGSEAIARAAFELMSCDIPLIGTCVGVMPDLLPNWALVPPANPEALQKLLTQAICQQGFRAKLLQAAQNRIADLSEKDFLRSTLSVYEKAWQERSARSP